MTTEEEGRSDDNGAAIVVIRGEREVWWWWAGLWFRIVLAFPPCGTDPVGLTALR